MINPISSAAHGATGAGSLNEAVVRFGAMQESREQQRTERASDEEKIQTPVDCAFIEAADDVPDDAQQAPKAAGGEARTHTSHHASSSHDENSISGRGPGQDGMQEAQEQAIAQHASEQHGKRELGRQDVDRSQRSTREMMGRIESKGGVEEAAAPKSENAATSQKAAPSAEGGEESPSSAGSAPAAGGGGGGHVAVAGSGTPRVGSDVIAAAVSSGLTSTEEVAPGSAQASDADDDKAQDVDSSQEGVHARGEDQGKRVSRERSLDGHTGFHDGDGGRHDSHEKFRGSAGGGHQDRGRQHDPTGGESAAGGHSDEQPDRAERQPVVAEAPAPAEPDAEPEPTVAADSSNVRSSAASAEVAPAADTGATQPPTTPSADPFQRVSPADVQPVAAEKVPEATAVSAESFERTAPVISMGSDSLMGDEYFFFDDARFSPDAPASA